MSDDAQGFGEGHEACFADRSTEPKVKAILRCIPKSFSYLSVPNLSVINANQVNLRFWVFVCSLRLPCLGAGRECKERRRISFIHSSEDGQALPARPKEHFKRGLRQKLRFYSAEQGEREWGGGAAAGSPCTIRSVASWVLNLSIFLATPRYPSVFHSSLSWIEWLSRA